MPYVITLIAPSQAPSFDRLPQKILRESGLKPGETRVLAEGRAVDITCDAPAPAWVMDKIREQCRIDVLCQETATRARRLFMADMDATMVEEETLDELAAHAGIKDQIAAITRRAMNGELDFQAALHERVALLKGLPETALADTAAKMHYMPGGELLLKTLKAHNVHCVLVSGGFTYFTAQVAKHLGFDENHGNTLLLENGALTGRVGLPILDKAFKKLCLETTAAKLGIPLSQTVAIGDGANDLPMLQTAGLGVGYQSKQVLRDSLSNHLLFNGLDALVYGLGLPHAPPHIS